MFPKGMYASYAIVEPKLIRAKKNDDYVDYWINATLDPR